MRRINRRSAAETGWGYKPHKVGAGMGMDCSICADPCTYAFLRIAAAPVGGVPNPGLTINPTFGSFTCRGPASPLNCQTASAIQADEFAPTAFPLPVKPPSG